MFAVANVAPLAPATAMTVDTVYEDRIWLDWSDALDADNDRLTYRVRWWTNEGEALEEVVDGNSLEVTDSAQAGDTLNWQVQAIDLWGDGPFSETVTLTVIARPEPSVPEELRGACQTATVGAYWMGLIAVLFSRRRSHGRVC